MVKDKMLNAVLEQDSFVAAFTGERCRLAHLVEGRESEGEGGWAGRQTNREGSLEIGHLAVEEGIAWLLKLLARGLECLLSW